MSKETWLVIGLGKTGLSCIRYLKNKKYHVIAMDTRQSPPDLVGAQKQFPDVEFHCGGLDRELLLKADHIVLSPGIALSTPEIAEQVERGVDVLGDIELFAREGHTNVVAITGSNAKGTVISILAKMAECADLNIALGGNIGTPILDLIDSETKPDYFFLELSSFQLETTRSLTTRAASILNISEDHMDRYNNDMELYTKAKHRIYQGAELIITNRDDPRTSPKLFSNREQLSFGLNEVGAGEFGVREYDGEFWLVRGAEKLIQTSELALPGKHNWSNALAALAFGFALSLPLTAMQQALREFRGLPHRCQKVRELKGVTWYNDSKATNVGSAQAALRGLGSKKQNIVWLAGGQSKGADLAPLREDVERYVKQAILFGEDASKLQHAIEPFKSIEFSESLDTAVQHATSIAEPGDIVLLSPACASFDMFQNFEVRGEQFESLVENLKSE